MASEPNYEKVTSSFRIKCGTNQSVIECKLPAIDGVTKLLCSSARGYINTTEIVGKDINYNGFVSFQVIYTDGENNVQGLDYTAEFKDKYIHTDDLVGGVVVPSCTVVDINTIVNGNDVKVVAILEVTIDVILSDSTNVLVGASDVLTQKDTLTYNTYATTVKDTFEFNQDVEIKDSVNKVLSVCPSPFITKITPNNNFLTLDGGVNIDICYLTESGVLRSTQTTLTFNQEISGDVTDVSVIQSDLVVATSDVKITTSIDTDLAIVNISLPLIYSGYVFTTNTIDVITDAFSLTNFVNLSVESLNTLKGFDSLSYNEKIDGSLTVDDNAPLVDEIVGTCCNSIVLANTDILDGVLTVEGVAHTTIIYLNKELNNINSVEIEMPFSTTYNITDEGNAIPLVQLAIGNVTAKARRNKEIEVTAELDIFVDFYENKEEVVISKITLDDEIPEDECALSIYITRDGDNIWDIAKELLVSPEVILEQNPTLSEPIESGTRVVVYRQKMQEF